MRIFFWYLCWSHFIWLPLFGFYSNFERCLLYFSTYYDLDSVIDFSWGYFESDIFFNLNL